MTLSEYEKNIKGSLAKYVRNRSQDARYTELVLGLFEEVTEVTSPIRRTIKGSFHESKLDKEHLGEEIGDVFWYIAQISSQLPGCSLEKVVKKNLEKTYMNFGSKFTWIDNPTIRQYTNTAKSTYRKSLPESAEERVRFFCFGLIKEVGKVSELFGEHIIDGKVLEGDILNLWKVEEKLGDALWYLAAICEVNGLDLEEIAYKNTDKVRERYNTDGTVRHNDR